MGVRAGYHLGAPHRPVQATEGGYATNAEDTAEAEGQEGRSQVNRNIDLSHTMTELFLELRDAFTGHWLAWTVAFFEL